MSQASSRPNLWTVAAIAVVAFAGCDMVHEVVGHGLACWATPGVRALSLSTVALQTSSESRFVASAGSLANLVAGLLALLAFRRGRGFGPARFFWWLFASINLLNGTGYLLFSAALDFGDWAVVISGLTPHGIWRAVMGLAGAGSYVGAIRLSAGRMATSIRDEKLDPGVVPSLVLPAYVAGSLLFVAGAALNPIGPQLILSSGVSSGFGAMAGLAFVPRLAGARASQSTIAPPAMPFSLPWISAGVLVAVIFVGVIGPGVNLP